MGSVKWDQRELDKLVEKEMTSLLTRLGIRGSSLAKQLITGKIDPQLRAIDKGRLRASLTYEVVADRLLVRIGTNVKYAIFVFLGTSKMIARPVLRVMLMMLRSELKGK